MPDKSDKADKRRKMIKRVETKEDGRLLIYYTFEEAAGTAAGAGFAEQADTKAARK